MLSSYYFLYSTGLVLGSLYIFIWRYTFMYLRLAAMSASSWSMAAERSCCYPKYIGKPTEVAIAAVQFVVAHRHYGIFGESVRSDHRATFLHLMLLFAVINKLL